MLFLYVIINRKKGTLLNECLTNLQDSVHYVEKESGFINEYNSELHQLNIEREYHVEQLRLIHNDINIVNLEWYMVILNE